MGLFKTQFTPNYCLGVWYIEEGLDFFLNEYTLNSLEQEQFEKLKHEQKKRERMAGRLLIKTLLAEHDIICEGVLNNKHGKPFLIGCNYELSISHSHDFVAVIINFNKHAVGIDLQYINEKINVVAPRLFSSEELTDCENSLTKKCIYWSAKEALYKIHELRKLDFKKDLSIHYFDLDTKGSFTACIRKKAFRFEYELWDNYVLVYNTTSHQPL